MLILVLDSVDDFCCDEKPIGFAGASQFGRHQWWPTIMPNGLERFPICNPDDSGGPLVKLWFVCFGQNKKLFLGGHYPIQFWSLFATRLNASPDADAPVLKIWWFAVWKPKP